MVLSKCLCIVARPNNTIFQETVIIVLQYCLHNPRSWNSVISIVTRLEGGYPGVQNMGRTREFSVIQNVQTRLEAY
jgi:hypothetical protein